MLVVYGCVCCDGCAVCVVMVVLVCVVMVVLVCVVMVVLYVLG
jgi:hypothetical protein